MSPLPVRVETNASALPVGEYSGRDSVAGCDTSRRATAGGAAERRGPDIAAGDERDLAAVGRDAGLGERQGRTTGCCVLIDVVRRPRTATASRATRAGESHARSLSQPLKAIQSVLHSEHWNLHHRCRLPHWSPDSPPDGCWRRAAARPTTTELRDAFQALAATTLKTTTDEFLKLADQKIGNVHREAAIDLDAAAAGARHAGHADQGHARQQVDAKLKEVEKTRIDDSASMQVDAQPRRPHAAAAAAGNAEPGARAAVARRPRPMGRSAAAQGRRAGRHDGALRLRSAADDLHRGRPPAARHDHQPAGRPVDRRRRQGAARGVSRRAGRHRRRHSQRQAGGSRAAGEGSRRPSSARRRTGMRCRLHPSWSCCSCRPRPSTWPRSSAMRR